MRAGQQKGKVIIAGAGPGDPDLITVKTVKALRQAEVILVDRLVSEEILETYAAPSAEIVYVGKQCRSHGTTPQATINELLVEYALLGKRVLRLKGGDVSIFSNVLDELQSLVAHEIEYEIIPGITAALGAAAYAGIPLTARQHSTAVRFLTYYTYSKLTEDYWHELALTEDTLVFYMSSERLAEVVEKLTRHGISEEKQLAVVEQATTPLQHVQTSSLYDYAQKLGGKTFVSPSLVIIGRVVNLHHEFKWFTNNPSREHYFKPVAEQVGLVLQ
ncbi:uroporphyrinogen-III C-methyltransferase [Rufibacter sediminis]|uniref:uroporphyrinogen-III C-methyltransferase n=1 Tax=Rufibacter sediminis TaxID=2762756 RepID=A0ABR6VNU0_9BACT|nr:uroporphyrinogen-III C-methyltransferase [Rufibacter sediminis]MBC3538859.1 uroporphyrinogen-III C-methyltransferase [Rufibacter sediminis]